MRDGATSVAAFETNRTTTEPRQKLRSSSTSDARGVEPLVGGGDEATQMSSEDEPKG
jgi:hypothetical protein